ncbi:hypothetical protein EDC56_0946 [Sinobacterium caligoides]|uniref:Uncharacterized protein n=1 Tax=Sinobacterium caligoides TaxID=933926 RepID=A0A3N2DZY1_9GAMM|nr:hypothetical protein [Sinobacterium caligoides]ROS05416.1 hypothetical protein EDC56_0946 [Sinobacterium caligoides]
MPTLQELMGQEIYDLLYTHYDKNGELIEDMEDVFYCDEDEIPKDSISRLEALLTPITDLRSSLVPIESAKLLAAWGSEKAIDYLEYCIDSRIDCLGNLDPHRLHADYDTTYERFADSLFQYHVRYTERDYIMSNCYEGKLSEEARNRIMSPLIKIIALSKELVIDLGAIKSKIYSRGWKEYLPALKDCYFDFIQRPEDDLNRQWNLQGLTDVLQEWDSEIFNGTRKS